VNEIAIMRKLNHEHTIKLFELHESENSVYLVLELVKGGELVSRLKSATNYSEMEVKMLLKNFLSALVHVHKNKIMHRDLKPENILLRNQTDLYDIVLADFGLAAFMTEEELLFKRCGTPGFVAPEVLHYKEGGPMYDERCDIFSAGIIFYLLLVFKILNKSREIFNGIFFIRLSGKRPFDGKDYKVILQENKKCQINFELPIFKKISAEGKISPFLKTN
jgi:serine/threonine protein kinase